MDFFNNLNISGSALQLVKRICIVYRSPFSSGGFQESLSRPSPTPSAASWSVEIYTLEDLLTRLSARTYSLSSAGFIKGNAGGNQAPRLVDS